MTAIQRALLTLADAAGSLPRWMVIALGCVAFVFLLGLPTLIIPLGADQVTFALGARTILDGGQLYSDFWDIKPPVIHLLYALAFVPAGEHFEAVRVLDLVNTALAMAAIVYLGQRLLTLRAGVFGAAFYAFAYLTWAQLDGLAEAESFMAVPLVLALAIYWPDTERRTTPARALAAGALIAAAVGLKPSAVVFALGLPAAELLLRQHASWSPRDALLRLGWAALGFFAILAALAAYLAIGGALDDYVDIQRHYVASYNAFRWSPEDVSHPRFVVSVTGGWIRSTAFIVAPALLALLFAIRDGGRARGVYLLAFVSVMAVAGIWWQGKMLRYHWVIMFPLLGPLAGYTADRGIAALGHMTTKEALGAAVIAIGALMAFAITPLLDTYDNYRTLLSVASGSLSRQEAEARSYPLLRENRHLVEYVEREGGPEDTLYVWGFWPVANFWLDRPLASRFVVNNGLRADWAPMSWRQELVDDLTANQPTFVAVARGDVQPWMVGTSETSEEHLRDSFPELLQLLTDDYAFTQDFGLFVLYERLPQGLGTETPPETEPPYGDEPLPSQADTEIDLPDGFASVIVAEDFTQPTSIALGPAGEIYVSQRAGPVFRLIDDDGDGIFERRIPFTSGISGIHGLAFSPGDEGLYVSSIGRVTRVRDTNNDMVADLAEVVISQLPNGRHENNGIAFGPDGKLYITNGSTCNDCEEVDERSATILQANPDGSDLRVYATGLRNSYDLVFDPEGRLWATDNGTDPPCNTIDELNLIQEGYDYGWPYGPGCDGLNSAVAPVADLGFNTASTGIDYYDGRQFPVEYRGNLFITLWGSLGYAPVPAGRVLIRAIISETDQGPRVTTKEFATGFQRPIDVLVDADGTLLVLDFGSGRLYRIVHS